MELSFKLSSHHFYREKTSGEGRGERRKGEGGTSHHEARAGPLPDGLLAEVDGHLGGVGLGALRTSQRHHAEMVAGERTLHPCGMAGGGGASD